MYIFNPTLGEQMPFHCEETLTKNLDWNERPLHPHLDSPWHGFDAWFWDKMGEKQKPVSFDSVWVERAWGYANINNKRN